MPGFVHLHTHTEFSLLDGLSSPKALAQYAAELDMPALAITDHGVMFGVVDFYKACQSAGIKPIIGIETYLAQGARTERNPKEKPYHLVLLAQNQTGYLNLLKLASEAQLTGFYYKPRIDKELLAAHSDGVIALSACVAGEVPRLIYQGQEDAARQAIRWYQEHFPERFYLELQTHDLPEFDETYRKLVEMAREMDVPLVATNDIHYAKREHADAHDVLLCIQTGKTVNEPNRMRMTDPSYHMRSPQEMWDLYGHLPDALENTLKIAEQCDVTLQFAPPYHLPKFPVPDGCGTSEEYLRHLCNEGLVMRYGEERAKDPEVQERLNYELGIIHDMGFDDYFLIVWDLGIAAKERDIWWNVRGSGAGSVVAYTLEITNVDPLKNRLMFERFLNPARVNMPDIDLDYPDDRREELIAYTVERYGEDHVAQIITFGTLGARAAVRDVGRALDIPLSEVDRVARLIPSVPGKPVSIAQALEAEPDLRELAESTPYIKKLLEMAEQVEGVARHASTHAAGVLVSDKPLTEYLPLHRPTRGDGESPIGSVSQWPMEIVDAMGMLKVDFLGLRTLTHMRKACEWIEKEHGRKLDLHTIPYERAPDDPELDADVCKLYELLTSGETTGVFQVEGAGMRRTLRELRPHQFQHIVAVLALYRPGPMDNIPTYIRRLHGEEEVEYHHDVLENLLNDTYGIIVYQEQIMQIAVAMAGYEPGEADMIRKAVAKKKKHLMEKHKKMFRAGAAKKGIAEEIADKVWGDIEFFARYGFNRAHATDYAVITAQTAYLKAHYPLEFMTGLMSTERNNIEKLGFLIADARRTGLDVREPDVNASDVEFSIEHEDDGSRFIRIGLGAIKNVGDDAVQVIVDARKEGGPFESLVDFADRVDLRKLNRRTLECLIQAGALDGFGERPALLTLIDSLIGTSSQIHGARDVGQISLFGDMTSTMPPIEPPATYPPIPNRKLLEWERELLGTYLSEHPLTEHERRLLANDLVNTTIGQVDDEGLGQQLTLVGMVQRLRRITTKKGDTMAFATLEGPGGTLDVVIFPRTFERFKELLIPEQILVVCGKLDNRADRDEHPLLADWFKRPEEMHLPGGNGTYGSESPGPTLAQETARSYAPPAPGNGNGGNGSGGSGSRGGTPSPKPIAQSETRSRNVVPPLASAPLAPEGDGWGAAPPPPDEPPIPTRLQITLLCTGDDIRDFETLSRIHRLLTAQPGSDEFVVILNRQGQPRVELSFPNHRIKHTPQIRRNLTELVGEANLRIVQMEVI